jgi:hypothetical protein
MPHDASPRFNWRMHPRPTPRPEEPLPHIPESSNLAKWLDQEPATYVDGMNHYIVEGDNPINAVNPLGT